MPVVQVVIYVLELQNFKMERVFGSSGPTPLLYLYMKWDENVFSNFQFSLFEVRQMAGLSVICLFYCSEYL